MMKHQHSNSQYKRYRRRLDRATDLVESLLVAMADLASYRGEGKPSYRCYLEMSLKARRYLAAGLRDRDELLRFVGDFTHDEDDSTTSTADRE